MFEVFGTSVYAVGIIVLTGFQEGTGVEGLEKACERRRLFLEDLAATAHVLRVATGFFCCATGHITFFVFGNLPRVDKVINIFSWLVIGFKHLIMFLIVVGAKETYTTMTEESETG